MRQLTWKDTQRACYFGYISQAAVVNLPSLLFVTFQKHYGITLTQLSLLIALIFGIQIAVDLLSAPVVDKIGYRKCTAFGFFLCALGLLLLGLLPGWMENTYAALLIALSVSSFGSGLMEVLISPITESLPRPDKASAMSLMHSFYCWGLVGVVLLSTAYFAVFGTENWRYLPFLWMLVPLTGLVLFLKVPMFSLTEPGKAFSMMQLIRTPIFWLFFFMMICAGASEQAMSQWASLFAESGLNVTKTVGDLLGPCAFAVLMGTCRVLNSRQKRFTTGQTLLMCSLMCVGCYLIVIFSPWPLLSLLGCALCGFSVGVMWPGVFSLSSARLPRGGTIMFALLAMAGDIGCCAGPAVVGTAAEGLAGEAWVSSFLPGVTVGNGDSVMRVGFLIALAFPFFLCVGTWLLEKHRAKRCPAQESID